MFKVADATQKVNMNFNFRIFDYSKLHLPLMVLSNRVDLNNFFLDPY